VYITARRHPAQDLLLLETEDALQNGVTFGTRNTDGNIANATTTACCSRHW
jgi:hypothetical protein